eukprot:9033848-Alexandrium_andersonii.AAC.1
MGVSGGAEATTKAAQTLADAEGFAAARLDGISAFKSQDRATALNRLNDVARAVLRHGAGPGWPRSPHSLRGRRRHRRRTGGSGSPAHHEGT